VKTEGEHCEGEQTGTEKGSEKGPTLRVGGSCFFGGQPEGLGVKRIHEKGYGGINKLLKCVTTRAGSCRQTGLKD